MGKSTSSKSHKYKSHTNGNKVENIISKSLESIIELKERSRICQLHLMQDVKDVNKTIKCVIACMETIETCDLITTYIVNRSPNTKVGIDLMHKVCNTLYHECHKMKHDTICKNCVKACDKVDKNIHTLKKIIK